MAEPAGADLEGVVVDWLVSHPHFGLAKQKGNKKI
jgi:hypothetical protein